MVTPSSKNFKHKRSSMPSDVLSEKMKSGMLSIPSSSSLVGLNSPVVGSIYWTFLLSSPFRFGRNKHGRACKTQLKHFFCRGPETTGDSEKHLCNLSLSWYEANILRREVERIWRLVMNTVKEFTLFWVERWEENGKWCNVFTDLVCDEVIPNQNVSLRNYDTSTFFPLKMTRLWASSSGIWIKSELPFGFNVGFVFFTLHSLCLPTRRKLRSS